MESYNPKSAYRRSVKYKNEIFPTIAEVSRKTGVSRTTIRRNCANSKNHDWSSVVTPFSDEYLVHRSFSNPVCVDGKIYPSERKVSLETGINRRTLRRQLDSPDYKNTYRISSNSEEL